MVWSRGAQARDTMRDAPENVEHVRAGAIVGVGFPQPFSFEGLVKIERTVGLGLQYGFLPATELQDMTFSSRAIAFDLRIFPFQGAFFFGLRIGKQYVRASATVDVPQYGELEEVVDIEAWFLNPRLGFLWTLGPGVTLGIDAGVQVPTSHTTSSTLPAQFDEYWKKSAERFGGAVLPTVDLLQLGVLL